MRGREVVTALSMGSAPAPAEPFPSAAKVALSDTSSTPASPIGDGLTVDRYLVAAPNDGGSDFLEPVAGRCTDNRFTERDKRTIDPHGSSDFKDRDGDILDAEYVANGPVSVNTVKPEWRFSSGTGAYDGISGTASDSLNLDDTGATRPPAR